jgi:hypothetical protein
MPYIRLSGGLGNQLFQYSFAKSIQKTLNEITTYDLVDYRFPSNRTPHKLEILKILDPHCINRPTWPYSQLPNRVSQTLSRANKQKLEKKSLYDLKIIRENNLVYDPNLEISAKSYYVGNFISHRYWKGDAQQTIDLVRDQLEYISRSKINILANSIGVHVRRGDYISNSKTQKFHGYCSDRYYLDAVKQTLEEFPRINTVSIASDSLEMLGDLKKELENLGVSVQFITEKNPILALFSLASHDFFIGSNSTFSWWAAALTVKKLTFFPNEWFASGDFGYSPATYFPFPVKTIFKALNTL